MTRGFYFSVMFLIMNTGSLVTSQSYPHPGSNEHLYPYGPDVGDAMLPDSDDDSSPEVHLDTTVVFFNGSYDSLWVGGA